MVKKALNREESLLFLLFDDSYVLAELNQVPIVLLPGFFAFLLAQDQVHLVHYAHALVLLLVVLAVGLWVRGLALNEPSYLILLSIHSLLRCYKLLELVD